MTADVAQIMTTGTDGHARRQRTGVAQDVVERVERSGALLPLGVAQPQDEFGGDVRRHVLALAAVARNLGRRRYRAAWRRARRLPAVAIHCRAGPHAVSCSERCQRSSAKHRGRARTCGRTWTRRSLHGALAPRRLGQRLALRLGACLTDCGHRCRLQIRLQGVQRALAPRLLQDRRNVEARGARGGGGMGEEQLCVCEVGLAIRGGRAKRAHGGGEPEARLREDLGVLVRARGLEDLLRHKLERCVLQKPAT